MKYFLAILLLFTISSHSQSNKGYNRDKSIHPACQDSIDLEACFESKILQLLDRSITKSSTDKIIRFSKKDTLQISSTLYFDETGMLIPDISDFYIYLDSLKSELDYLKPMIPKVLPVLDNFNNGVADNKNYFFGFKINREEKTLQPIKDYRPSEVEFSAIEEVPVFKGCTLKYGPEQAKKCMSNAIGKHIMKNFNINLANKLGLSAGIKRIYLFFKIDKKGHIIDIKSRAPHPILKKEAIRVLTLLPKLKKPGMVKGKPVIVSYALPITFKVK